MNLTPSREDYLETLLLLEKENKKIKSVDIATMLNISKPSVTKAMNNLKDLGLIEKTSYSSITLTDKGRKLAEEIFDRHKTIKSFLLKLGVSKETADDDCCKIEHVISKETLECIKKFINE